MHLLVKIFEQVAWFVIKLCEFLTIIIGGWLTLILITSVFFRFVLNDSITWVDETSALLLVCLMLAVAPIGFHEKIHISVDIVVKSLPTNLKKLALVIINGFSIILFGVIGYFGVFMVKNDFSTQMSSIPVVQGWFTIFLPIASCFVILICLNNILQIVFSNNSKDEFRSAS